ncbi:MAG: heat-shock protein Hsp70 [Planctomycetaceae bacterium]|nr:heat-shock protein Hsp70 [Planctomycetaceae bacterium]
MLKTHAVGIDLGTTYSCLAHLNEHGEPVTLPNQEGELSTPSVVLFDGDDVIVGTEALRNAVVRPSYVVQNSKRYIGDPNHHWAIDGRKYTPVDIATLILKKLLDAAEEQIGEVDSAIITVPAQFSELQRQATVEAGMRAGLKKVDIINEPVAAALCYVLGTEGLWFTELADEQRILVYDLGGGTFDLSLVRYEKEEVAVIASSGDLHLGGIDWNFTLQNHIADRFLSEFSADPREDSESLQFLSLEVENAKRGLSVRPRAALSCQHDGHRQSYQIEQSDFEKLTNHLTERTADITVQMLKDNKMGWAHVDVILTTGGASRMPMVRKRLKQLGGRTPNTSLSPDQSIAHGATYYAGMLLTNSDYAKSILNEEASARLAKIKQRSVNARSLGMLVRSVDKKRRFPHYLIPENTPLPTSVKQTFGTVVPNQKRVHLHIVESGSGTGKSYEKLGTCIIDDLPAKLPEGSQIEVTFTYNEQARVQVSAKELKSGKMAQTEIVREENVKVVEPKDKDSGWVSGDLSSVENKAGAKKPKAKPTSKAAPKQKAKAAAPAPPPAPKAAKPKNVAPPPPQPKAKQVTSEPDHRLSEANRPIPLCNECGEPLDARGQCAKCLTKAKRSKTRQKKSPTAGRETAKKSNRTPSKGAHTGTKSVAPIPPPIDDDEILELITHDQKPAPEKKTKRPAKPKAAAAKPKKKKSSGPSPKAPPVPPALKQGKPKPKAKRQGKTNDPGEEEFWQLVDD